MSPEPAQEDPGLLSERWHDPTGLRARFEKAEPFPHVHLPEFLRTEVVEPAAAEFPTAVDERWTSYLHYNERKYGLTELSVFPPNLERLVHGLCDPHFVRWLEEATGIEGLRSDPSLEGGGLHATHRGGFLKLHADFTGHHHRPRWRRRINLILFLNPGWDEAWGGHLELWSRDLRECRARIAPLLNHAAVFATDETSFHGVPEPVMCPEDVVRRSLALYYYTEETTSFRRRSTNYRARPSEGREAKWIWLDSRLGALYTSVKRRFGLSDRFVSELLRRFFPSSRR